MEKSDIIKLIDERLKLCNIQVPIEETFDYSNCGDEVKCKLFVKLVDGNWKNGIYVIKISNPHVPPNHYDLLFAINTDGCPICIPVPIAGKLFGTKINPMECRGMISGGVYESIYRKYYEDGKLPF
jgi:hypothetical protein